MNPELAAKQLIELTWEHGFPVDPVTIARTIGVDVLETSLPNQVSGALIKEIGEDAKIVIHHLDSNNRKRFSCSHELGHYVSRVESNNEDKEYEYIDFLDHTSSNGDKKDGVFANQFAACLLMPKEKVQELSQSKKSHMAMALFFGVSNEAMKYRLQNLNLLC